nr:calcium/proton exchanger [Tanacetum cinerariifolium]
MSNKRPSITGKPVEGPPRKLLRWNYNLGSLVTFRWIALHFFKELINDQFMSLRKMRDDIRKKFMIDVSLGRCRRAKQLALFDHEGGLIEHYGRLYQYRQALLDSNPGSACRLDVEESSNGSVTFKRIYICFKGVKDGWLLGCRKGTASCTLEQQFIQIMDQIKQLDEDAYDYLIKRNPNSWSRAFFEMDRRCATFENGISESFSRAILEPKHKPIITMLEEIRLYIMQRLVTMNKITTNLQDTITPSIRKRLEVLKEKQRTSDVPPLPSLVRRMPGRPQNLESKTQGHNKVSCKADPSPKSPVEKKTPGGSKQSAVGYCASRGRGRDRGRSENKASVNRMGGIDEASGGGRGGTGRRGRRGRGTKSSVGGEEVVVEEYQLQLDEKAFRECMEEQAKEQAKNDAKQERLDKERREEIECVWVKDTTDVTTEDVDEFPGMKKSETTNVAKELSAPAVDKGKGVASVAEQDSAPKKKRGRPPSHIDGVRIYHKNHGRSKRIAKMKEKKAFEFDKHGTCSTPDKAFDVSE